MLELNACFAACEGDWKHIAPMAEPNRGGDRSKYATFGTPTHYSLKNDLKRSFQLGVVLMCGGQHDEGMKIMNMALDHFPIGDAGQEGVHAAEPSASILSRF